MLREVISGSDVADSNKAAVIANIEEAFDGEEDELLRILKEYPRLVQKHAMNPQLMYDISSAWEEELINHLTPTERTKLMRTTSNFEVRPVPIALANTEDQILSPWITATIFLAHQLSWKKS